MNGHFSAGQLLASYLGFSCVEALIGERVLALKSTESCTSTASHRRQEVAIGTRHEPQFGTSHFGFLTDQRNGSDPSFVACWCLDSYKLVADQMTEPKLLVASWSQTALSLT